MWRVYVQYAGKERISAPCITPGIWDISGDIVLNAMAILLTLVAVTCIQGSGVTSDIKSR